MKTISISISTFNEEGNVLPLYDALLEQLRALEGRYDYEIVFIDNRSTDSTREKLRLLCARDRRVRVIFNTRNFGQINSAYYGFLQTTGDCTIGMCADFQDPPALLGRMVETWEQGHKIVGMVKTESDENPFVRFLRTLFYRVLGRMSDIKIIENYSGFGLYDKCVVDAVRALDDPLPFGRGIIAELGFEMTTIPFAKPKRRAGKSSNNFFTLYDLAMLGITTYTKILPRLATLLGVLVSAASFVSALVCAGLGKWGALPMAGLFLLGGIQLFFLGILGEYLVHVLRRGLKRPLVVEECRLNFPEITAN